MPKTKHGLANTREYRIWWLMISRCHNPDASDYQYYGARGIIVCDEWRSDFMTFLEHVGKRPSPKHSIDRYPDNNGNYEPENVRWSLHKDQMRNYRRNVIIEFGGESLCQADWEKRLGFKHNTLRARLKRGWSVEKALTTPVGAWR